MTNLKVDGMSCDHCRKAVEQAIQSVPGVVSVEVALAKGSASIEGNADVDLLIEAVQEAGYEAKLLSRS